MTKAPTGYQPSLYCVKHGAGPLDVWYDCASCLFEHDCEEQGCCLHHVGIDDSRYCTIFIPDNFIDLARLHETSDDAGELVLNSEPPLAPWTSLIAKETRIW